MAIIDFGGVKENVVTRKEFSLAKARKVLKKKSLRSLATEYKLLHKLESKRQRLQRHHRMS